MALQQISIYDEGKLEAIRRNLKISPHLVRVLRKNIFKHFQPEPAQIADLFGSDIINVHALRLVDQVDSKIDGATKLLLQTDQGMLIESVILRIASGRTTICVSSQIGCAAACQFCATGKMGIARNLSAAQIVDQVLQAGMVLRGENRVIRNVVFMGMGEPFHNEENLYEAIRLLTAAEYFHLSPNKLLVSTVGVVDAMLRFIQRFPNIPLALSLHSANQTVRERLIPLAKRYPLTELQATLRQANRFQKSPVMIEYLMLDGINDSLADANELIAWISDLRVHVNLIPYNKIGDEDQLQGSPKATRELFAGRLKDHRIPTTIRHSLGSDIAAACGQLVQHKNRAIARQLHEVSLIATDH